ncbi:MULTISPECIES: dephospho-CoA kinase [Leuconostoc]|jgi:dephospho-CoA kinase|uniref:dephospho-CoA kinase n=1 Tax=Leuconostoc TaxID=1243 RepID=UPI0005147F66|nr:MULTISPECIES: dephospho-CoA kinase [Leuconostoc]KAF0260304.1 dephospho-CoA kinase [Leuconostoc citreum]MBA5938646.1 dephospho-CoA kinase [Leuconostoc citreum]MBE4726468.1 dephospho-CoA kinase [Leuconostoc citreum]MCP1276407.1 dephospho-CoA kinase [Leuconostoc citreum]MCQ6658598.1 dephospho-CoA kinase [Leuconostoc citreum]
MVIIGLTGSIATGKSTVSTMLRDAGMPIVDADVVAREVVEPGTHTLEAIKLAFGPGVIENGVLNRSQLGNIVFDNQSELQRLNAIMQPAIRSVMADKINFWRTQHVPVLILDIPLLFEREYDKNYHVDKIIVVSADPEVQLARLKSRDSLDERQAKNRMRTQMPIAEKVARADYVINNNGDKSQLKAQVDDLIEKLKDIAPEYDTK